MVPGNKDHATEQVIVKTTPTSIDAEQKTMTVTATSKSLVLGAFSVFILFFIGAIASCFGACWGMSCKRID